MLFAFAQGGFSKFAFADVGAKAHDLSVRQDGRAQGDGQAMPVTVAEDDFTVLSA